MNLVAFSIRTKGVHNFSRRLGTVFTRFGLAETRQRRALYSIVNAVRPYGTGPTFFIPAVVLDRHAALINTVARDGAEIGIHGYVHNDYRSLTRGSQLAQTLQAMDVFARSKTAFSGFRNPYLGWTDDSVEVFEELGFTYDSNEAVVHDVVDLERLTPQLRDGYAKSLELFQAIPCAEYTLRPHTEGALLRIPTSIPDDEMLFDRLRITEGDALGAIWSDVLRRVYDLGGIYVLNLHPERGILCRKALDILLSNARRQPLPVWVARLDEVAAWWRERSSFRMDVAPAGEGRWQVTATCSERATVLVRKGAVEDAEAEPWSGPDQRVREHSFTLRARQRPCIGLSVRTAPEVAAFLAEQGYPTVTISDEDADDVALFLDLPDGLGTTRTEQRELRTELVARIERLDASLVRFGCWPDGSRASLSITGDIDSVTIQDFFLRVLEARQYA